MMLRRAVRVLLGLTVLALVAIVVTRSADASPPTPVPGAGGQAHAGAPERSLGQPKVTAQAPATDSAVRTYGVDISAYQHPSGASINWRSVAAAGKRFVEIKATEGTTYRNPYYAGDALAAKRAGLYVSAYDFGRPDLGNPVGQADALLAAAPYAADGRTLPPMLDMEWPYSGTGVSNACWGLSQAQMNSWIESYLNRIRSRIGVAPLIYTASGWWNPCTGGTTRLGGARLVVANWSSSPYPLPSGWSAWTIWQYSSSGSVPGIAGAVDLDQFNGPTAGLAALATPNLAKQLAGDSTGDKRTDLIDADGTDVNVMPLTDSALGAPAQWYSTSFYGAKTTLAADVNGDGKADLIAVNASTIGVLLSTGTGYTRAPGLWFSAAFYGSKATLAADVNGDGKADLIAVNTDNAGLLFSTGTKYTRGTTTQF